MVVGFVLPVNSHCLATSSMAGGPLFRNPNRPSRARSLILLLRQREPFDLFKRDIVVLPLAAGLPYNPPARYQEPRIARNP